jgi:murein DD-endopeptidase MepM/ murein hydrolase activator NlpD
MRFSARTGLAAGSVLVVMAWSVASARSARRLPVAEPIVVTRAFLDRADTLRRNQTLSELFARHNIVGQELVDVLEAAPGLRPRRLRAGQIFLLRYPLDDSKPDRITMRPDYDRVLRLERDSADRWSGEWEAVAWTVHLERVSGVIASSLDETLHEVIPDSILPYAERSRLVWDLAEGVYGWVVDFFRDVYPGDRIEVLYERLTSALGDVRYGRVVAAKLETRGAENPAYVLTDERGGNAYYDAGGKSLRRAFKLYPAKFRYISSGFSRNRYHPILRTRRPHLGVDYRAARGAPVSATGDGVVVRAGRWGGYGIVVAIRHPRGIETRYAHLNGLAPAIRAGTRVVQGQTIGYVGMTGLATAPHLHYEFIQNGRHVNPRVAAQFGTGEPVPAARRAAFDTLRARYDHLLAQLSTHTAAAGVD